MSDGGASADEAAVILDFSRGLGVYPSGPVINDPGNAYAGITVGLPIFNTDAETAAVVTCAFRVHVTDYRGHAYSNGTVDGARVHASPVVVAVPAAGYVLSRFRVFGLLARFV